MILIVNNKDNLYKLEIKIIYFYKKNTFLIDLSYKIYSILL